MGYTLTGKSFLLRLKVLIAVFFLGLFALLFLANVSYVVSVIFILAILRTFLDRFDYKNPIIAFVIPWSLLFLFYCIDITDFTRKIDDLTLIVISFPVLLSSIILPEFFVVNIKEDSSIYANKGVSVKYIILVAALLLLFFANVAYSGFLPLVNIIFGGEGNYMDYGIKGINGLFNAYANAFAVFSYYLYIKTSNKVFLFFVAVVLGIFVVCVTRQNIISLLVEITILHSFFVKSIPKRKIVLMFFAAIVAFGVLGELRTGDIRELMRLKANFYWLPTGFIWVYSYGYFNILNLDNLVTSKAVGLFDGSSLATLLPSFLRPSSDPIPDNLEAINFTVSSYINPILKDWGAFGVFVFTSFVVGISSFYYKMAVVRKTFLSVSIYCVLYYCALFSFFVNFWFYLPIIFQIPCFVAFDRFLMKRFK